MRVLSVVALVLLASGCQSADERKLTAMVEQRVAQSNLQVTEIGEPYIYRASDDARMACLTVQLKNQWGELQPRQRVIAWYIPRTDSWHTDNFRPADDGLTCQEYVDPNRQAAQRASEAVARGAAMDNAIAQMQQDAARAGAETARHDQVQNEAYQRAQQEHNARQAVESEAAEAEFERRQREADVALQESLENGAVSR